MREPEVSGKKVTQMIVVLCICLILITMTGSLLSDSIKTLTIDLKGCLGFSQEHENQEEVFKPEKASFTFPAMPSYIPKKNELTPILRTRLQPGFSLSSNYQTSDFFQGGISYVKINVKNEGRNPIFIDRYGASVNASEKRIYSKDCGVMILPGEEKVLGVIDVKIPEDKKATFNIVLWLLAETSEGKWHEYEPYYLSGFTANLKPMHEKFTPKYKYNPAYHFKIINRLVEPEEPEIRNKAAEVARSYPGAYNIYQVCALFDMVKENIEYVSDPRGNDVWEPANVTLEVGAGDCEDQAILLSSMLEAVGGTTRVYLTDTHAFAAVYIGNSTSETKAAVEGIRTYYGNVDVNYLTDEYGSWLMLDPTSSLYAGGLPGQTAQAKIQTFEENETYRSWTFSNTSKIEVIDINPDK